MWHLSAWISIFLNRLLFGVIKNRNWTQEALRDCLLLWSHSTWHFFLSDLKFNSLGGLLIYHRANLTDLRQSICNFGKASDHFWKENSLAWLMRSTIFMTEVGTRRCPKMGEGVCVCTDSASHGLDTVFLFWIYWLDLWKTWNAIEFFFEIVYPLFLDYGFNAWWRDGEKEY